MLNYDTPLTINNVRELEYIPIYNISYRKDGKI